MAKLVSEDLELEFIFIGCYDFDPVEYEFKVTLKWKNLPILNEKAMKRETDYWEKGKEGGIIAEETDNFTLISDLENAIETKSPQIWEAWPDPDMCISIYPERCFPYLNEVNSEYYTIIISPDAYQFKDCDAYCGYEGVSFIMTPKVNDFKKLIDDLKFEFNEVKKGRNLSVIR